ncbi:MurT ligase domain-containing protein [Nocardioides maradonensis]
MADRYPRIGGALLLARLVAWLSRRVLHRGGNVIGGAVLLRLAPRRVAAKARRHRITLVSGTNGKSTTTAMVAAALGAAAPVTSNRDGANTPNGLAWAVARAATDEVVLEVDEAWLPWAARELRPATVLLLDLTRDQLHRKPEILPLAAAWRDAVSGVPLVVAVADDPAVVWAAQTAGRVEHVATAAEWSSDSVLCPVCRALLHDRAAAWWCGCGFHRPVATTVASSGHIRVDGEDVGGYTTLPGPANLANAAMAIAATRDRVDPRVALAAITEQVHEVAGRYQEVRVGDRSLRLLLAKNPAGWQATLGMLRPGASVALVFSAEGVDGRDTSWLYDVAFDPLRQRSVAVAGPRGTDLAVRLHLDGIEAGAAYASARAAVGSLPPGAVDVVATYDAFQHVRRELDVA